MSELDQRLKAVEQWQQELRDMYNELNARIGHVEGLDKLADRISIETLVDKFQYLSMNFDRLCHLVEGVEVIIDSPRSRHVRGSKAKIISIHRRTGVMFAQVQVQNKTKTVREYRLEHLRRST